MRSPLISPSTSVVAQVAVETGEILDEIAFTPAGRPVAEPRRPVAVHVLVRRSGLGVEPGVAIALAQSGAGGQEAERAAMARQSSGAWSGMVRGMGWWRIMRHPAAQKTPPWAGRQEVLRNGGFRSGG